MRTVGKGVKGRLKGMVSPRRYPEPQGLLTLGGAELGGQALLGASRCGGGDKKDGPVDHTFSLGLDNPQTMRELIDRFNRHHEVEIQAQWRQMSADTRQYSDQLRTEFQVGGGEIDVIGGGEVCPVRGERLELRWRDSSCFVLRKFRRNRTS